MKPISRRMKQVNREKDGKPMDTSQLRQPITLGGSTLNQILNAVHYGSPEMRALLQVECNFIFECKVCRSLFRDFPNFISHKRVFCDKSALEEQWINLAHLSEEEVVMVEPEGPVETASQGPSEDSTSVTAVEQEQQTEKDVDQTNLAALGSSERGQLESSHLDIRAEAQIQCAQETLSSANQPPDSGSETSNLLMPSAGLQVECSLQSKGPQMGKKSSSTRLSLEDTVQRLQSKNSGQSYSLEVYDMAAEKIERQKESTLVTTIKTTAIPTNNNAVFVDFSTRTRKRGERGSLDETQAENRPKENELQLEETLRNKCKDTQKQSRRKGLFSTFKDTYVGAQKGSVNMGESKQSKRKDGDTRVSKGEEKQSLRQKKEFQSQSKLRQLRLTSQFERKGDARKAGDTSESFSPLSKSSRRSRFAHSVPDELIRVGKPRTAYPEPQQILMDQLREMQDKVKQKAAAEGKADAVVLSDDEEDDGNDKSATEELPKSEPLSPTKSDDMMTFSPASKRSPSQKSGVYKCRMCTYEGDDKADCMRHIMRKHRYAMRHKSALAVRSMAVYQSSSKKQGKTNQSPGENENYTLSSKETVSQEGEKLHDIVRKNLQVALQKAEEVLKSRQGTSPEQSNISLKGTEIKQEENGSHQLMCLKCNRVYSCKASLSFHVSIHHSDTRTFYPCNLCKKVFASLQGLQRHLRTLHEMSAEKVDQMREKLKKKAFIKKISQSEIELTCDKSSQPQETSQKRASGDNELKQQRPSKRQKLGTRVSDMCEKVLENNAKGESDLNSVQVNKSSVSVSKEPVTKNEVLAVQIPTHVSENSEGEAEKKSGPSITSMAKHSISEKVGSASHKDNNLGTPPSQRHKPSPHRSMMPKDLSPRPASYVCRKCKHHFGRKISFDNHIEMCRGRRIITTPSKSDKKVSVISGSKRTSPVAPKATKEDKETAKRDQSTPKPPTLLPNYIGTRSKHRDSSSESQRSAGSDTPASLRTRARVTRSLSPERNNPSAVPLSGGKSLSREKQVRRQIASFGNIHDGLRGRARRTVFSKYATLQRPDQAKQHKTRGKERDSEDSSMKNKVWSKNRKSMPSTPTYSSANRLSQPARQQENSKESLKMITDGIQTRHAKTANLERLSLPHKNSSEMSKLVNLSFMETESNQFVALNGLDQVRDSDLSSTCSGEYSDSDNKHAVVSRRARKLQQQLASDTSRQANLQVTPESKLQLKLTPKPSKQANEKVTPYSKLHEKPAPQASELVSKKSTSGSLTQEKRIFSSFLQLNKDKVGDTLNNDATETKSLKEDLVSDIEETCENNEPHSFRYSNSLRLSDINNEKIDDNGCLALGSTEEGIKRRLWKAPNSEAIDKLMDVIKHTPMKKTTNRGRPLDEAGLELSCIKPGSSQSSEKHESDCEENSQHFSRGCQEGTVHDKAHNESDSYFSSLSSKNMSSSGVEFQTDDTTKTGSKPLVTQEVAQMKKKSAEEIINAAMFSSSSVLSKTNFASQPCKPCIEFEESSGTPQTIDINGKENVCFEVSVSVKRSNMLSPSAEISDFNESEKLCSDSDKDIKSCVRDSMSMDCDDNKLNEVKNCTLDQAAKAGHQLDVKIESPECQQAQSSNDVETSAILSDKNISLLDISVPSDKNLKAAVQQTKSLPNSDQNTFLKNYSTPELRSRSRSSKHFKTSKSQNESVKGSKPDFRCRIVSRRIKEKHRALASRLSKATDLKTRDSKILDNSENISNVQAVSFQQKSVQILDTKNYSKECIAYTAELENLKGACEVKSDKKKEKEGCRIKTSANRAYVMRSLAGEKKLECFDKAKIFKYVDAAKIKCLACGMKYTKMYNLRRHIISNHLKWTRYRCSLCGCEKYDKAHCLRHIQKVHKEELRERSAGPAKSLIINLTKQGSQARSVKISHSIKKNQESEQKLSESIYARPTLSLRRRGRPTLPLLSSTAPPQKIPAGVLDNSSHTTEKSSQEDQKYSSQCLTVSLPRELPQSLPLPHSLVSQQKEYEAYSKPAKDVEVNGQEIANQKQKGTVTNAIPVKVAEAAQVRHPYSICGSEEPYLSVPNNDNGGRQKHSEENDNIFAQLQSVEVSSQPSCSIPVSSNLSRRGLAGPQKGKSKNSAAQSNPLSALESQASISIPETINVPFAEEFVNSDHSSAPDVIPPVSTKTDVSHSSSVDTVNVSTQSISNSYHVAKS